MTSNSTEINSWSQYVLANIVC